MIRVVLPAPLLRLAQFDGEVGLEIAGPVTPGAVVDAIESRFPMLRGTLRDPATRRRRAYVRFFACGRDLSHEPLDGPLPEAVARGDEPFLVVGAMSGG
jgi:hypothetical protein